MKRNPASSDQELIKRIKALKPVNFCETTSINAATISRLKNGTLSSLSSRSRIAILKNWQRLELPVDFASELFDTWQEEAKFATQEITISSNDPDFNLLFQIPDDDFEIRPVPGKIFKLIASVRNSVFADNFVHVTKSNRGFERCQSYMVMELWRLSSFGHEKSMIASAADKELCFQLYSYLWSKISILAWINNSSIAEGSKRGEKSYKFIHQKATRLLGTEFVVQLNPILFEKS